MLPIIAFIIYCWWLKREREEYSKWQNMYFWKKHDFTDWIFWHSHSCALLLWVCDSLCPARIIYEGKTSIISLQSLELKKKSVWITQQYVEIEWVWLCDLSVELESNNIIKCLRYPGIVSSLSGTKPRNQPLKWRLKGEIQSGVPRYFHIE